MSSYDISDADPDNVHDPTQRRLVAGWSLSQTEASDEPRGQPLAPIQRIEHLWRVHHHTQEAIQLCDKKSSVLIALAGSVMAGLITATAQGGSASLVDILSDPWAVVSLTALMGSILLAAVSIKPRLWREADQGSVFWQSILTHDRPQGFAAYVRAQTVEAVADHLAHQVFGLARICRRKYAWFAWAFYLSIAGGLLSMIAAVHARVTSTG